MNKAEIIVDVSQFVYETMRSGIQRLLVEMISAWPQQILPAAVGYRDSEVYRIVSLEQAGTVLRDYFHGRAGSDNSGQMTGAIKERLDRLAATRIQAGQLDQHFSAFFLPEPTFRDDVLDTLCQWNNSQPLRTFAIFYDALPQTHPQHFGALHQMGSSRYFREIARIENVGCISKASLDCLIGRLRRRKASNAVVVTPGANQFARVKPFAPAPAKLAASEPSFVSVGTIEPRKNHPIILAAFNELWRDGFNYELHFIGASRQDSGDFLRELSEALAANPNRFRWSQQATDAEVRCLLEEATGAIFVSEAEGYGLPAVEALAAGCPIIAAASLPALSDLPSLGQERLREISIDSVKTAVRRLVDAQVNNRLRSEITQLRLPTWQEFAFRIASWIRCTLDGTLPSDAGKWLAELGPMNAPAANGS